jgi:hypothetical protein
MFKYSKKDVLAVLFNLEVKAFYDEEFGRKAEDAQAIYGRQPDFLSDEELERVVTIYGEHYDSMAAAASDRLRDQFDEQEARRQFSGEIETCRRGEDILREGTSLVYVEASDSNPEAFANSYGERQASPVVEETRLGKPHYWMLVSR